MPRSADKSAAAAGYAALSICESLLLALDEQKILSASDVRGVLEDAAATHQGAAQTANDATVHRAAAALLEQMLAHRNRKLRP